MNEIQYLHKSARFIDDIDDNDSKDQGEEEYRYATNSRTNLLLGVVPVCIKFLFEEVGRYFLLGLEGPNIGNSEGDVDQIDCFSAEFELHFVVCYLMRLKAMGHCVPINIDELN